MTGQPLSFSRLSAGHYESTQGHQIDRHGREWMITWPGRRTPDVSKPSLRAALEYVRTDPEG